MKTRSYLKYIKYLGYIIIIFLYLIFREYAVKNIKMELKEYKITSYTYLIPLLLNVGLGLLLGLEHLVNEIKKEGAWKINWPKIIFMVIPSLYFSIVIFFYFINNSLVQTILSYPAIVFLNKGINFIDIFQLMLGYFMITSIYKQREKKINLYNLENKI